MDRMLIHRLQAMLSEKDISPMAPWDNELPKFINDPRYSCKHSSPIYATSWH